MALSLTDNSATIGVTEFYLASNSTTKTDQTDDALLSVWIDFGAMLAGDQYRVKLYEKATSAGTQRSFEIGIVTGAQAFPWVSPMLFVGHAWEISVTKLTGTDRAINWSLRKAT